MNKYPKDIPEAARLLDVIRPGWYKKIDVNTLWMRNSKRCVLGQLFGSYHTGMEKNGWSVYNYVGDRIFGTFADAEQWKREIKMRKLPETIEEGASLLDEKRPGWANEIDLRLFTMRDEERCVLGQLYGKYGDGWRTLFPDHNCDAHLDKVFGLIDNAAWIKEIEKRRSDHDIMWALRQLREGRTIQRGGVCFWLSGDTFCCGAGSIAKLGYDDLIATDWQLDNRIEIGDLEVGEKFIYVDNTYVRCQREKDTVYAVKDNMVHRFHYPTKVHRGQ